MQIKQFLESHKHKFFFGAFILGVCTVNLIALWPLLTTGYINDDAMNSFTPGCLLYSHRSLWEFTLYYIKLWIVDNGRFFPLAFYSYALFTAVKSLIVYKILTLVVVFISLFVFSWFVYVVSKSRSLFWATLLFPSIFIQYRLWFDPVLAFHFMVPVAFLLVFLSLILFWNYCENRAWWKLVVVSALFLSSLLLYEISIAYVVVFAYIAIKKNSFTFSAVRAVFPVFFIAGIYFIFSAVLRSQASCIDPTYRISFDVIAYLRSVLTHITASFPGIYYLRNLSGNSVIFSNGSFVIIVIAGAFFGTAVTIILRKIDVKRIKEIFPLGVLLLLLPFLIICLSQKHQNLPLGVGYLPVFFGYSGAMLLLICFYVFVNNYFERIFVKRAAFCFSVCSLFLLFVINASSNLYVANSLNRVWLHPRNVVESAVKAGLLADVPDGSKIIMTRIHNGWELEAYKYLVYLYGGKKRVEFVEAGAVSSEMVRNNGAVPLLNLYIFMHDSDSKNRGFAAIAKVTKAELIKSSASRSNEAVFFAENCDIFFADKSNSFEAGAVDLTGSVCVSKRYVRVEGKTTGVIRDVFDKSINFLTLKTSVDSNIIGVNDVVGVVSSPGKPIFIVPEFTIELKVKPQIKQCGYSHIIGNHPGQKGFQGFVVQQNGGEQNSYVFSIGDGSCFAGGVRFHLESDRVSHIWLIKEKERMLAYVNGVLVDRAMVKNIFQNSELVLSLGNWIGKDRPFSGEILEARIYGSALTDDQILRKK